MLSIRSNPKSMTDGLEIQRTEGTVAPFASGIKHRNSSKPSKTTGYSDGQKLGSFGTQGGDGFDNEFEIMPPRVRSEEQTYRLLDSKVGVVIQIAGDSVLVQFLNDDDEPESKRSFDIDFMKERGIYRENQCLFLDFWHDGKEIYPEVVHIDDGDELTRIQFVDGVDYSKFENL